MKKFVLIGKNIDYSLSPVMHNNHFKFLELDASYTIKNISSITEEISNLRQLSGFNITVPFKEDIIKFCDTQSPEANIVGAVNCVNVINNKFHGHNTDVYGFYKLLEENNLLNSQSKQVLIVGSGGAAKAVYYCFKKYTNDTVYITNRTISKAMEITNQTLTILQAEERLADFDLVVNCTSVTSPLKITKVKEASCFIDINYQLKSQFLADAKNLNAETINGLTMLLYQAMKSFEIWFNMKADLDTFKKSLIRKDT